MGKPNLDVAPRQCASSRVASHPQLSGKTSGIRCPHPPYSPDLAPADIFLFPKLKTTLQGRRMQIIEQVQENATRELRTSTENAFQEAFQQWKKHWEWCISSKWDYFEWDSA